MDSFLGIFISDQDMQDQNITSFILEEINLYHQPMPDPIYASIFFLVMAIEVIAGLYLHKKVLVLLKKENGIVKNVTKTFVFTQMLVWPLGVFMITITNFIHPLQDIFGKWFCFTSWIFLYFSMNLIFSHSFIVAMMRYFFIVHSKKVNVMGKEKVKKLFHLFSILLPTLVTLGQITKSTDGQSISFVNKCYGKHHKTFLIETSTSNVFKKNFCEINFYGDAKEPAQIIGLLMQFLCVVSTTTMIIMGTNLTEGIIYARLFSYMRR
jgi:hypothetical protein